MDNNFVIKNYQGNMWLDMIDHQFIKKIINKVFTSQILYIS